MIIYYFTTSFYNNHMIQAGRCLKLYEEYPIRNNKTAAAEAKVVGNCPLVRYALGPMTANKTVEAKIERSIPSRLRPLLM